MGNSINKMILNTDLTDSKALVAQLKANLETVMSPASFHTPEQKAFMQDYVYLNTASKVLIKNDSAKYYDILIKASYSADGQPIVSVFDPLRCMDRRK
jgi:hypothetical protein